MDTITIRDLEVFFRVGVPEDERARPQRLLISVEIEHDFTRAAETDDLQATVDYFAVSERIRGLASIKSWRLIETLAVEIAQITLEEFKAARATVEIKKFIIPQARHVAVKVTRGR